MARIVEVRPAGHDARASAERVLTSPMIARTELVGVHGPRPGSGRADGEFWQTAAWFLKSRASRVFADVEAARRALDQLDATKRALDQLTPAGTILAIAETPAQRFQLWTLAPQLVTLREGLDRAVAAARWDDVGRGLAGFALGLGAALACSVEAGHGLDANPSNFAIQGGRLRYIDDDVATTWTALGIEDAFAARFGEYERVPAPLWDGYVRRVADEIAARVSPADRRRIRLPERLEAAAVLRRPARRYVEQLLGLLEDRS